MLNDKIALITGASRGIGRSIARTLAEAGADIAGMDINMGELSATMKSIEESTGRRTIALRGDVGNYSDVEKCIEEIMKIFGAIHILVNNAGITRDNIILRMKDEEWHEVIKINLTGTFNCTRAVIKKMVKNRYGRIINISSVVGMMGNVGQSNYAASKAGIIGFTRSVSREYASRGITVNAIAPGFIETDMTRKLSEDVRRNLIEQIPMRRLGLPDDVAKVVKFLASDDASYITGQVIHVNGGMYM